MAWRLRFWDKAEATLDHESGEWVSEDESTRKVLEIETEHWLQIARPPGYDPAPTESLVEYLAKTLRAEIIEREEQGELDPNVAY